MNYLPFLKGTENNEQSLRQSLNDMSNLTKLLNLLYGSHNNFEKQIDFFRIIYLIYESIIATNEKIQNEKQLTNRFMSRFGREPHEELVHLVVMRLVDFQYITASPSGYTVSTAGIRMFSVLFNFISNMFAYHQKEDSIEKVIFLTELAGLEFKIREAMDIDNSSEFIHLVHTLRTLTEEIKENLLDYVNQSNALEKIRKLQELIEKTIGIIQEYVATEKMTDKIDNFRLRIQNIDKIIQEATLVSIEGLGEVIKAIQASTSQVVHSSISPALFYSNLVSQIKDEFLKQDAVVQSAYEIALSMDSAEPMMYVPNKIFGAISNEDIWSVIDKVDNNEDFGFSVRKSSEEFDVDIEFDEPNYTDIKKLEKIEKEFSIISRARYAVVFAFIYDKAIAHSGETRSIYEWIQMMCEDTEEQYFFATVFMDFIHYLNKFSLLMIQTDDVPLPKKLPEGWRFIKILGYPSITGKELVKFPPKEVIEEYDYSKYKKKL